MDALLWLFKVNIAIILLYIISLLLLRQDTFFRTKRFVIVSSMLFAFIYPFINIKNLLDDNQMLLPSATIRVALSEITISPSTENMAQALTLPNILFWSWIAGMLIFSLNFLLQLSAIIKRIQQSRSAKLMGFNIRILNGIQAPFSFFHYSIIDPKQHDEKELHEILCHEATHVREGHTWDVIFSELCCIICWMNPFVWLLKKEIRMNLEFLADRAVITSEVDTEHYQLHLLRLSYQKAIAQLSNNFNVSPLKKRIHMMNKKSTPKMGIVKYAIMAPFIAGLLFTNNVQAQDQTKSTEQSTSNDLPDITTVENEATATEDKTTEKTPPINKKEQLSTSSQQSPPQNKQAFEKVEQMPEYPGGVPELMKYLSQNIIYPTDAQEKSIQGMVVCNFIVDAEGNVTNVKVLRSLCPTCDQEAIKVIEAMPKWIPGKQDGQAVAVYYTLPIRFKLANDEQQQTNSAVKDINNLPENVIFEVDGKTITKEEFNSLDVNKIKSLAVDKNTSPAKIIVTTKK